MTITEMCPPPNVERLDLLCDDGSIGSYREGDRIEFHEHMEVGRSHKRNIELQTVAPELSRGAMRARFPFVSPEQNPVL